MNPNPNLITLVVLVSSLARDCSKVPHCSLVNPVTNCSKQFSRKDVCGVYVYLFPHTCTVNHRK